MASPQPLDDTQMYLGDYLLERLAQLGVRPMLGVPGDFNLTFLDLVEAHETIEWVGCCNELNAAYSADGYSRVKQSQANYTGSNADRKTQGGVKGLGCLLTTFGVGELSAMNGVAGAFSERVPFLHIVGVPSTKAQSNKYLLHHTLGDGQFDVFKKAAEGVTAAQAFLESADNAPAEIDRVLRVALEKARPTYLTLPTDLVYAPVLRSLLDTPIVPPPIAVEEDVKQLPTGGKLSQEQLDTLEFVTTEIQRLWEKASNPIVLVDACAIRYGVPHLVRQLVDKTGVKYFSTPMGKGALQEDYNKGFGGVYAGEVSDPSVKASVEASDLVLFVGSLKSDFNSGEFSHSFKTVQTIELHSDHTIVQYATYPTISFHSLLPALTRALERKQVEPVASHVGLVKDIPDSPKDKVVTQAAFWPMMSNWFEEDDIVIVETGTSSFGCLDVALPGGSTFVSQVLWGSIGWAGGATLGCLLAAKEAEYKRRTILFIGDGSLQLTVQEIATMMRQGLKPIIVVLNNDGYVIERLIHGETAKYNDISSWKWQSLLDLFDANESIPHKSWLAETRGDLETILSNPEFASADKAQLLEVKMDRLDAPRALIAQAKLSAQLNAA